MAFQKIIQFMAEPLCKKGSALHDQHTAAAVQGLWL